MIKFLGRTRLWPEVVGQRLGEVAQCGREEGGTRRGIVHGEGQEEAMEVGVGSVTE